MKNLILDENLHDYFYENIKKINKLENKKISVTSIEYISELLSKKINNDFIFNKKNKIYLFDLYKKIVESQNKEEKIQASKRLGDYSLVTSGYFTESINNIVGLDYYINMGSSAYSLIERDPFFELSKKYLSCISILNKLSAERVKNSREILITYNFWLKSKDIFSKEKLLKLGLITEAIEE